MSKVQSSTKRILAAAGVLCLLLCLLCPVPVAAASPATRSIDITVDVQDNGDATITEVWDVTTVDGTEFYLTKYNLYDTQQITDLSVTDETGREYTNIGTWDSGRSKDAKADECGLVETHGGYEICWGLGAGYGDHVYTVRYTMTNLLQGYDTGDAINQTLVASDLAAAPQRVSVTIYSDEVTFTGKEFDEEAQTQINDGDTAIWGLGYDGEGYVQDGQVVYNSTQPLSSNQYVAVLVIFDKGMFHPAVERTDVTLDEMREAAMEGSSYSLPEENNNGFSIGRIFNSFFAVISRLIFPAFIVFVFVGLFKKGTSQNKGPTITPKQYAEVPYSREIPFKGSLPCTYIRLKESSRNMGQNEGSIMGAYLLRWANSKQVELLAQEESGFFKSGSSVGIKLYNPRPDMPPLERSLYDILVAAAGPDWVLQSKELEKYSRKNYQTVERWYNTVKSNASAELRQMGATTVTQQKSFFGLFTSNVDTISEYGNQLTYEMYGFKKYLEDFTIINEREAREVELWDEYLVYAQIFGIAETVAQQFQQLYPKYFTDMQANMGGGMTMYDTITVIRLTNMISRSAYSGYRSGYNAAHSSSSYSGYSGGGGSFGGGGGGGGGGFGGGGGGGTR